MKTDGSGVWDGNCLTFAPGKVPRTVHISNFNIILRN